MRWYAQFVLCAQEMFTFGSGRSFGAGLLFGAHGLNALAVLNLFGLDSQRVFRTWWPFIMVLGASYVWSFDGIAREGARVRGGDDIDVVIWSNRWRALVVIYLASSIVLFLMSLALNKWFAVLVDRSV